jgi:hypothetical protein
VENIMGYINLLVYDYLTVVKMWVLLVVKLLRISGVGNLAWKNCPYIYGDGSASEGHASGIRPGGCDL